MTKRTRLNRVVSPLFAVILIAGCLIIALKTQDVRKIISLLRSLDLRYCLISVVLTLIGVTLTSANLHLLLTKVGTRLSWGRIFEIDLFSLLTTYYTPAGSGGLAYFIYALKKHYVPVENSATCFVLDKIITVLLAVLSFGILAVFKLHASYFSLSRTRLASILLLITLGGSVLWAFPALRGLVRSFGCRLMVFKQFPSAIITNVIITTAQFCVNAGHFLVAFRAIHAQAPPFGVLLISYGPLALLGYLPFTISGAGVSDAAAILLWKQPSLSSEEIIAAFMVLRLFLLIGALTLPACLYAGKLVKRRVATATAFMVIS